MARKKKSGAPAAAPAPATAPEASGSTSRSGDEKERGRGGYRNTELSTIPTNVSIYKASEAFKKSKEQVVLCTNYIRIARTKGEKTMHKYRVDFEPDVESTRLRRELFKRVFQQIFPGKEVEYDGGYDAKSSEKTPEEERVVVVENIGTNYSVKLRRVGTLDYNSFETLRLYNFQMKSFLRTLGFYQINKTGVYVTSELRSRVGADLSLLRGYITSANIHDGGHMLMNLESCHKAEQNSSVLDYIAKLMTGGRGQNVKELVKSALIGKLVVTTYRKQVYRIQDVNYDLNPKSSFEKTNTQTQISYFEYFKQFYGITIKDTQQPLLIVVNNNKKKEQAELRDIKLVPELCRIAGLTDEQRGNFEVSKAMIRASQIAPKDELEQLQKFLSKLNSNEQVRQKLTNWGYRYEPPDTPITVKGHKLDKTRIGVRPFSTQDPQRWPEANADGGFDNIVTKLTNKVAVDNPIPSLAILIDHRAGVRDTILGRLKGGFDRVGCQVPNPNTKDVDTGNLTALLREIRAVKEKFLLIIIPYQNKGAYDTIKKYCSIERGLLSQVVTGKLMMDEKKSFGAATKIAIQVCAKNGGAPWLVHLEKEATMICGYDTHHDTADRGKSFGAFVASMNASFSSWWSKADKHDKLDELSAHLSDNIAAAMKKFKEKDPKKRFPQRIVIYRDGVSDGQIEHVFQVEIKNVQKAIKNCSPECKFSFIIVNKRIGARFYMKQGPTFVNPTPGSVVDETVTRNARYDFYLVSQSTRAGTVTPTYYNIIYDDNLFKPEQHQQLAYRLCSMYYNWTGTVRVPAPCQYAHKLAYICGEHLHSVPNINLDDRLHFL